MHRVKFIVIACGVLCGACALSTADQPIEDAKQSSLPLEESCSGWESDPQSFSKRIAESFCQDAFNTPVSSPDTIRCSGSTCVVHYAGVFPFDIKVDLSGVPGSVSASGTCVPFALRPQVCS